MNPLARATNRRTFLGFALTSPLVFSSLARAAAEVTNATIPLAQPSYTNLKEFLAPFREANGLPAIAAGVMKQGVVVGSGVVGVRKLGDPTPATMLDKFHLGSCTKALTATVAARLVEQGRIQWGSTLAGVFPERAEKMHPGFRKVTLELLLNHRAGVPRDNLSYKAQDVPIVARRLLHLDSVIGSPPESEPNTRFAYSNAGYTMVGALLERASGQAWETLMQERLFRPLGMTSAVIGTAAKPSQTDQPWGHQFTEGKFVPQYRDRVAPVNGPGGNVHCAVLDYLRFGDLHASNGARSARLLSAGSLAKLHTARKFDRQGLWGGEGYAMGWFVKRQEWANGLALTHQGSDGANLFVVWIGPGIGLSLALACNAAGGKADVLNRIAMELARKFGA